MNASTASLQQAVRFDGISRAKPLAYSSSGSEISRNDFHSSRRAVPLWKSLWRNFG
jgi:hypothetical protein